MQYLLLAVYSILAMTVLHVFKSSLLLMDIEVISSFSLLGKRLCRVLFFFFYGLLVDRCECFSRPEVRKDCCWIIGYRHCGEV